MRLNYLAHFSSFGNPSLNQYPDSLWGKDLNRIFFWSSTIHWSSNYGNRVPCSGTISLLFELSPSKHTRWGIQVIVYQKKCIIWKAVKALLQSRLSSPPHSIVEFLPFFQSSSWSQKYQAPISQSGYSHAYLASHRTLQSEAQPQQTLFQHWLQVPVKREMKIRLFIWSSQFHVLQRTRIVLVIFKRGKSFLL